MNSGRLLAGGAQVNHDQPLMKNTGGRSNLIHHRADNALNCQEIVKRVGIRYGINRLEDVRLFLQNAGVILVAAIIGGIAMFWYFSRKKD